MLTNHAAVFINKYTPSMSKRPCMKINISLTSILTKHTEVAF